MKDHKFIVYGMAFLLFLSLGVLLSCNKQRTRPKGVDKLAEYIGGSDGGVWISRKSYKDKSVISVVVYNDYTGEIEFKGIMELCDYCKDNQLKDAHMTAFDGENLYLNIKSDNKLCYYKKNPDR